MGLLFPAPGLVFYNRGGAGVNGPEQGNNPPHSGSQRIFCPLQSQRAEPPGQKGGKRQRARGGAGAGGPNVLG